MRHVKVHFLWQYFSPAISRKYPVKGLNRVGMEGSKQDIVLSGSDNVHSVPGKDLNGTVSVGCNTCNTRCTDKYHGYLPVRDIRHGRVPRNRAGKNFFIIANIPLY